MSRPRGLATERFDSSRHSAASFRSGNEALDRWLTAYASQNQRRDAARTFVAVDDGQVTGYYALLVGELEHAEATDQVRRGLARRFPIPVAILARLAVDQRYHRRGLGAALLADALARVAIAAEQLAIRAVVVHAIDEGAVGFYERYGFRALGATRRTLMVTLAELRAAGYP